MPILIEFELYSFSLIFLSSDVVIIEVIFEIWIDAVTFNEHHFLLPGGLETIEIIWNCHSRHQVWTKWIMSLWQVN